MVVQKHGQYDFDRVVCVESTLVATSCNIARGGGSSIVLPKKSCKIPIIRLQDTETDNTMQDTDNTSVTLYKSIVEERQNLLQVLKALRLSQNIAFLQKDLQFET